MKLTMKNNFLLLLVLCFIGISNTFGQTTLDGTPITLDFGGKTALEKAMKIMNVNMNLSPLFTATQNEEMFLPAKDSISRTIDQIFFDAPVYGNAAINTIFGNVHSILTHKNGECKILVFASGEIDVKYGKMVADNARLFNVVNSTFNRIKKDFRYGTSKSATREQIEELDMMVRHCPKEQAKEMFNADDIIMYPLNLRGNAFEDKYTRSRAVVVAKNGLSIFFYFLMTDESVKNFDQYLKDLSGSFMFN